VRRLAGGTALLLAIVAGRLAAQSMRGTLVEEGSGRAVAGGLVILLDSRDSIAASAATSEQGRFALLGLHPGDYRLKLLRIGFQPWISPPLALAAGQAWQERLEVPAIPVLLEELTVKASSPCRATSEGDASVGMLWEEAQKNLGLAERSLADHQFTYTTGLVRRTLGPDFGVGGEQRWSSVGKGEWPVTGLAADSLAANGYVQPGPADQGPVYYGPDARTFFSQAFLRGHCFRALPGPKKDPGLIGLGFEPMPGRELPDIEGVLWLDRRTAELRVLEYTYTGLWRWVPRGSARGRVEFVRLASGSWIISAWELRAPIARVRAETYRDVGKEKAAMRRYFGSGDVRLDGFREIRGTVELVRGEGDTLLWQRAAAP
jgi:carboxypeptidase family protein